MKILMPTQRECKRYVGFEILTEETIDFKDFESIFMNTLKEFIGTYGVAKSGAFVIKDTYKKNKGIVRVNNKYIDHIKAVFALIKEINKKKIIVKSVRTSGMINKVFLDKKPSKKIKKKTIKSNTKK